MTRIDPPDQPIGEQDLAMLESLAEAWTHEHGGMPLEALDGLFSALQVVPGATVEPEEYLALALGGDGAWADAELTSVAHELLLRLRSHVAWRVARPLSDPDDGTDEAMERDFELLPFVGLPSADGEGAAVDDDDPLAGVPRDFPLGALWASGFLQGLGLRPEGWSTWAAADEDLARDLEDLARLTIIDPEQSEAMGFDWSERLDFDQRWDLMASVPALLKDLHLSRLEEQAGRSGPGTVH